MSDHSLRPGTVLASHAIEEVLGQGGFGITYRVREVKSGRISALKEYFPSDDAVRVANNRVEPKQDRKARFDMGYQAFLSEARTLNALPEQRGLVRIKGAFEKHATVYALMDFIDGEPLDKATRLVLSKRSHVPVVLIQDLVEAMLGALRAVHQVGVLHRDIKPGNVMIRRDGQPVLIDFGAARPIARASKLASMFSRRYAALEQFPEARTGFRSTSADGPTIDMFAFSIMLYELVSQSLPPDAEERFKTRRDTGHDPFLPVRENILRNRITARYPDVLLDVIDAGCALLPSERIKSANDMAQRLDGFIETSNTVPPAITDLPSMPKPKPKAVKTTETGASRATKSRDPGTGTQKSKSSVSGMMILVIIVGLALGGVAYGYLTQ
jgi:serine/threonine protein kinase